MKSAERSKSIIRTSVIGIAANILLAAFKGLVGLLASSVAIIMDGVNNLSDALSSVITIIGTKLSQRPADLEHPFGHGRVEYFSAIIISVIVITAGVSSSVESFKKLIHPTTPEYSMVTITVIVVAILVKIALGRYVKHQGEKLDSESLIASGSDALFDAMITFTTLISAAIMLIWNVSLDGILGLIISVYIVKAGIEMLSRPVNELLGSRFPAELVSQIKQEVMSFDKVQGVFDIILHNYGPELMIGSLHITIPDDMTAYEIHGLTREISQRMFTKFGIILTIGVYASSTSDKKRGELQNIVFKACKEHKEILQSHGFYYNEKENSVSVDIVPCVSVKDEQALAACLHDELCNLLPGYTVYIVVDHNYSE